MKQTIKKEDNLLSHNTTEELAEELAMEIVHSETGTYEPVYQRVLRMITEHDKRTHNLALSQVLEKLPETTQYFQDKKGIEELKVVEHCRNKTIEEVKSIITSLQKE